MRNGSRQPAGLDGILEGVIALYIGLSTDEMVASDTTHHAFAVFAAASQDDALAETAFPRKEGFHSCGFSNYCFLKASIFRICRNYIAHHYLIPKRTPR